ncbi:MAG: M28 family peptidase [Planctomycetia bacterium]|nr:M28 family peptidase [Planctomycetia bacterium]
MHSPASPKPRPKWWPLLRDSLAAGWHTIRMPGRCHRGPLPAADDGLMQLAAELRRDVAYLAEVIGERNVVHRPRELALAADYIAAELAQAGFNVLRQEYDVSGTTCCNLEVEIPGTARADEIVVIGAHYDSVHGSPAANDNGSGVAAVLSLARTFVGTRPDRTLRFVAFVNEELPYAHTPLMGSSVYARRCRQRGEKVTAMLSLETIGCYSDEPGSQKYPPPIGRIYPSRGNFIGFIGNTRYGRLVRQVIGAFRQSEHFPSEGAALPEAMSSIGRSDHWSFWQEGYPALMVTDTAPFRYPHYHTAEDTVDKIDFERMARVVRGLRGVVGSLVGVGGSAKRDGGNGQTVR